MRPVRPSVVVRESRARTAGGSTGDAISVGREGQQEAKPVVTSVLCGRALCSLALLANVGATLYALAADVGRRAGDQLTPFLALPAEGAGQRRLLLL